MSSLHNQKKSDFHERLPTKPGSDFGSGAYFRHTLPPMAVFRRSAKDIHVVLSRCPTLKTPEYLRRSDKKITLF